MMPCVFPGQSCLSFEYLLLPCYCLKSNSLEWHMVLCVFTWHKLCGIQITRQSGEVVLSVKIWVLVLPPLSLTSCYFLVRWERWYMVQCYRCRMNGWFQGCGPGLGSFTAAISADSSYTECSMQDTWDQMGIAAMACFPGFDVMSVIRPVTFR